MLLSSFNKKKDKKNDLLDPDSLFEKMHVILHEYS